MVRRDSATKVLTKWNNFIIMAKQTGCGEVWYRAWFGSKRPRVRIPTLRPKIREWLVCRSLIFNCSTAEPGASWVLSPSGFREAESEWGHPPHAMPHKVQHCFGFESRHSDQIRRSTDEVDFLT